MGVDDRDEVYLQDFEEDDLVYFTTHQGIAANLDLGRVILFDKRAFGWVSEKIALADLRRVETISTTPGSEGYFAVGDGLHRVGASIGVAIKDSIAKAKARREAGLVLHLRSVDTPVFFIHEPDNSRHASLCEAFRQLFEGEMRRPFHVVPPEVERAFVAPTPAEIAAQEVRDAENEVRRRVTSVSGRQIKGLTVVALGVPIAFAIYQAITSTAPFRLGDSIAGIAVGAFFIFLLGFFGLWFLNGLFYRPSAKQTDGRPPA
ncbi:hypothetical protein [Rhodobacter sp. NSM]|uniref:hypothetical protein n=1 Tax=Rhodobacter sp. NSM TaxID=3457501 RepID=UPI003FD2F4D0